MVNSKKNNLLKTIFRQKNRYFVFLQNWKILKLKKFKFLKVSE